MRLNVIALTCARSNHLSGLRAARWKTQQMRMAYESRMRPRSASSDLDLNPTP